jgi:hypothetical protein
MIKSYELGVTPYYVLIIEDPQFLILALTSIERYPMAYTRHSIYEVV